MAKPLLLTPDDVGTELMRRDGMRVEALDYHYMNGTLKFLFSDMIWRFHDGRVFKRKEMPDDIAWRITEQVA